MPPQNDGFAEGTRPTDATLDAVKEMLRRAYLTLLTIENTSRGPQPPRTAWPAFPRDASTAYAAAPVNVRNFTVTPWDRANYLDLLGWFASYMNPSLSPTAVPDAEHVETVKIFKAWCGGASIWELQHRMTTNRRRPASKTLVYKRIDQMVYWIALTFSQDVARLLKTFRVDRVDEVDQKRRPTEQATPVLESGLADLPTSPRFIRAPSVPDDHPDAVAARESARLRAEADEQRLKRRLRQQRQHGKKDPQGGSQGSGGTGGPGDRGGSGSKPAAFQSAA